MVIFEIVSINGRQILFIPWDAVKDMTLEQLKRLLEHSPSAKPDYPYVDKNAEVRYAVELKWRWMDDVD